MQYLLLLRACELCLLSQRLLLPCSCVLCMLAWHRCLLLDMQAHWLQPLPLLCVELRSEPTGLMTGRQLHDRMTKPGPLGWVLGCRKQGACAGASHVDHCIAIAVVSQPC